MANIMIIRHAEKPSPDGSVHGVTETGNADPHELSVRGWQRAGALVRLFAPDPPRPADATIALPARIFASAASPASPSLRPQHTVGPLATMLGLALNIDHAEGEESALATAIMAEGDAVLVCWHHEHIVRLVRAIAGADFACPPGWPDERFDMIWRLDRSDPTVPWRFTQVPQLLLAGDLPDPIH